MKRKEQFDWAVGVGVKAYHKDTLKRENSCGCFGGNLVAEALHILIVCTKFQYKYSIEKEVDWIDEELTRPSWYDALTLFRQNSNLDHKMIFRRKIDAEGLKQIESTGYTIEDFDKIESAFESGRDEFEGLMNVVDVLCQIHEADEKEMEEAKGMFVKDVEVG